MTTPTETEFENEVFVLPGRCVAWTASAGHCSNVTEGLACDQHARDFKPPFHEKSYFSADEYPEYASMSVDQRSRFRKMVYMRAKRAEDRARPTGQERAAAALNRGTEVVMLQAARKNGKRREYINSKLDADGYVSTADVAQKFGISRDTVANLLGVMVEEGLVERVYGGAKRPGVEVKGGALRRPRQNS